MPFRPEFREALTLLATAVQRLQARGLEAPILVGGAAVELFTGGRVTSGDFDFVSASQDEFFAELLTLGFVRPQGPGWLTRSLLHPELGFGVQVVSGHLMDGRADRSRVRLLAIDDSRETRVIACEDLIADRMAQALAGRKIREDMRNQAVRLYQLAGGLDDAYLDLRVRTETGDVASLETLREWLANESRQA
ncbi:MAG: hypothetical protein PSV46_09185 [Reyranella sp.]|nr:hypothetical protein [Reyranella sp.]